jgi:hypothetical protein
LITLGAEVVRIDRWRDPLTDIEEDICGSEVPLAPVYLCAKCGEKFLNLTAYGYCVDPTNNMFELLKEHWEKTGFKEESCKN